MAFIYHLGAWPGFKYSLGTQLGTEFSLLLSVCPSPLKLLGNARSFFLLQSITDTCLLSEQSCSLQLASQQPEQLGGLMSTSIPSSCSFYTASSLLRINSATRICHAITHNPQCHLDQLLPHLLEAMGRCSEVEEEAAAAGQVSTAAEFAEWPLHRSCSCHA